MGLIRLLTFILVIYAVWRLGRALLGPLLAGSGAAPAPGSSAGPASSSPEPDAKSTVQDMFECHVCKSYITASSPRCDRFDCPR